MLWLILIIFIDQCEGDVSSMHNYIMGIETSMLF